MPISPANNLFLLMQHFMSLNGKKNGVCGRSTQSSTINKLECNNHHTALPRWYKLYIPQQKPFIEWPRKLIFTHKQTYTHTVFVHSKPFTTDAITNVTHISKPFVEMNICGSETTAFSSGHQHNLSNLIPTSMFDIFFARLCTLNYFNHVKHIKCTCDDNTFVASCYNQLEMIALL